jgi:murein DD-endopeptidase
VLIPNRIASLTLAVAVAAVTAGSGRDAGAQPRAPLVQSADVQVPVAPEAVAVGGRPHLVYELHITNFRPVDLELVRVEVRDADSGAALATYDGDELARRMRRIGAAWGLADVRRLPPGTRAAVFLWLPLDRGHAPPRRVTHALSLDLASPVRERIAVLGGAAAVGAEAPLVLGPPVHGGPWVALYDPLLPGGHRTSIYTLEGRARIPARYAIDFIRVHQGGAIVAGDRSRIANWHGYGADVLAVADGVVAAAVDDMPEDPSIAAAASAAITPENASGNYVTLDLGAGRFVFYEHLQHRSIAVAPGDRVRRGQVIARLGNSGSSSSGPHLHFHVSDAVATLAAEGRPFVFDEFEVMGAYSSIDAIRAPAPTPWTAALAGEGGRRRHELPAPNRVLMFAAPPRR